MMVRKSRIVGSKPIIFTPCKQLLLSNLLLILLLASCGQHETTFTSNQLSSTDTNLLITSSDMSNGPSEFDNVSVKGGNSMQKKLIQELGCSETRANVIMESLNQAGIDHIDDLYFESSEGETMLKVASEGGDYTVYLNKKYRVEMIYDAKGNLIYGVIE